MGITHELPESSRQPWMERAACAGLDTDPPVSLCTGCSVRIDCLRYALQYELEEGTWGGHTELERALLLDEHGGDVDEAIIASSKLHAITDARARAAAMIRHPSSTPATREQLRAQLELDFGET